MKITGKIKLIISIALFVLTIGFLMYGMRAPKISFIDNQIRISGLVYGERIDIENVKEISLLNQMPRILIRTNGFALGGTLRGYFRLEDIGRAKLFFQSREAPFILIEKKSGKKIFLNYRNSEKTQEVYEWLRGLPEK